MQQIPVLLQHEHRDGNNSKDKKNKKRKKDKDSDAEDDTNITLLEPEKIENIKENDTGTIVSSSPDERSSPIADELKSRSIVTNPNEDEKINEEKLTRKKYILMLFKATNKYLLNLKFFSVVPANPPIETVIPKVHIAQLIKILK